MLILAIFVALSAETMALDISAPSEIKAVVYIASPKSRNTIATAWHRWKRRALFFREESIRRAIVKAARQ